MTVDPNTGIEMADEKPEGVVNVSPSGIAIYYQWFPKRLYRINPQKILAKNVKAINEGRGVGILEGLLDYAQAEGAELPWVEVPGVTTVLDVLHKPALTWWGQTIGIGGLTTLIEKGWYVPKPYGSPVDEFEIDHITDLLTAHKLTVNHQRDKAADRGQAAHDAFEAWAKEGIFPEPEMFPLQEQGYVRALCQFLLDSKMIPDASEVQVGSKKHGFAGRYDLRAHTDEEARVVVRRTPTKLHYATIPPSVSLNDLKTSKHVYESHFVQLEAYEGAGIECGHKPTDHRGVIHVMQDGFYEYVPTFASGATYDTFLAVKACWEAMESLAGWKTRLKKGTTT